MARPSVAILGASTSRQKFGNMSVRAHQRAGYEVFPVNPRAETVEGLTCLPSLADVPGPLDRISVYLPAAMTLEVVDQIVGKTPGEVWLNPGAESPELVEKLRSRGLNVILGCSIVNLGMSPADL